METTLPSEKNGSVSVFRSSRFWLAGVVGVLTLSWMVFLTHGLSVGDPDDWDHILFAQDVPWKTLLTNIVHPWSQSPYWFGQGDFHDHVVHERVFPTFLLKVIATFWGPKPFAFYTLYKGIFFTGTTTLLFLLIADLTRSNSFAIFGTAFFVMVPVHYLHTLWISDPVTLAHFCILLGVWMYLRMIHNLDHHESFSKFTMIALGSFLCGWIGMKTKSPALILPIIMGLYTLIHLPVWHTQKKKLILLSIIILSVGAQVIPIEHLNLKKSFSFTYHGENVLHMVLYNPQSVYGNEQRSAFFSQEHIFPSSIARVFGFYPLWVLILFILLTIVFVIRNRYRHHPCTTFLSHPLVSIALIWILTEMALMGIFLPESRFFSGTMIPATLLCLHLIRFAYTSLGVPLNRLLMAFPLFALGWNIHDVNFRHIIWLRSQIGPRYQQLFQTAKSIYRDQFPKSQQDTRSIAAFYSMMYIPPEFAHRPRLPDVSFHFEFSIDSWKKTPSGFLDDFETFAKQGAPYYVTSSKNKFEGFDKAVLLETISGVNARSLFDHLIFGSTARGQLPIYIFKWTDSSEQQKRTRSGTPSKTNQSSL